MMRRIVKKSYIDKLQDIIEQKDKTIEHASSFIKEIEKGNLDIDFDLDDQEGKEDSLQEALVSMRDQLKKISQDEKERNWMSEGIAKFADILREDNENLEALGDHVLSHLVRYLEVNQGGLFILNDEDASDVHLELVACYAYDRKKFMHKKIAPGEGLVGQVFLEKEPIYLIEVPDDFVNISSGLGDARPSTILIVPLKLADQVYGVIELASFRPIKPYQQEFMARLGESLASTVSSARVANRTKVLLEESQKQAEEMRAQEEEIRQNMEEMQATQEEMRRKSSEIESQINAISESGVASVEFDLSGQIKRANANFLSLMGYSLEEVQGKHHRLFVSDAYAQSEEYQRFWETLGQGIPQVGEYERRGKDGKRVYIKGSYSILRDPQGAAVGVLKLAVDITEARLAQEKVEKQEEELKRQMKEFESQIQAIHNSGFAAIEFDLQGNILTANAHFLSLMGYSLEEIQGQHHRMFVTEKLAKSEEYASFLENLSKGQAYSGEFERITKAGKTVYIKGSYSPILDENNQPVRLIKLATDISETREASQQALQQAEELQKNADRFAAMQEQLTQTVTEMQHNETLLSQIIDASTAATVVIDREYNIITFNRLFEESMQRAGIQHEVGTNFLMALPPEQRDESVAVWEKVLVGERQQLTTEAAGRRLEVHLSPLKNNEGDITGIISHSQDVTELYQLREANRSMKQK